MESRRSAILTYHSLDESGSVLSVRPEVFCRQMEMLAASGVAVVPLTEAARRPGAVALTFDDGFANFAEHAVPVLQRWSLPATVFVVSGYCGQFNNWPTQPAGVPRLPLMDWETLRQLPSTVSLGAHTVTHPDLRALDEQRTACEILQSRADIEQKTGRPVESFAYPYGSADSRSAAFVRRHFRAACGTRLRFLPPAPDPALLPRLDVYYLKSAARFGDLLGSSNAAYIAFRAWLRDARRWAAGS